MSQFKEKIRAWWSGSGIDYKSRLEEVQGRRWDIEQGKTARVKAKGIPSIRYGLHMRGHGVSCIPIQTWPSMWRLSKALDAWKLVDRLRTSRRGIYPRQYPGRFASSVQQLLHVSRGYSPSTNSRMRSVSMRRMFSDDHAFPEVRIGHGSSSL
ncbi:hypothetical protein CIRG_06121 [Coccidioides immitis RMSCC 2394]|uniref:Uncharacterized protein n=1 Tax=Coccidioides immitis RMSCC 2394 TaxID=404692 RepID=A0A0J6YFI4_COCIT|nr:hypothetical protein CIRG_06121 [Coccidioides immitis RMSCC 2394]